MKIRENLQQGKWREKKKKYITRLSFAGNYVNFTYWNDWKACKVVTEHREEFKKV